MIGTIEDWVIINTYSGGHPIHIHLINFQVIYVYDLIVMKTKNNNTCALY